MAHRSAAGIKRRNGRIEVGHGNAHLGVGEFNLVAKEFGTTWLMLTIIASV
jgi:hypothetical protein